MYYLHLNHKYSFEDRYNKLTDAGRKKKTLFIVLLFKLCICIYYFNIFILASDTQNR